MNEDRIVQDHNVVTDVWIANFVDLSEQTKNITLNAMYHDYGYSSDSIESLDKVWKKHNKKDSQNESI